MHYKDPMPWYRIDPYRRNVTDKIAFQIRICLRNFGKNMNPTHFVMKFEVFHGFDASAESAHEVDSKMMLRGTKRGRVFMARI